MAKKTIFQEIDLDIVESLGIEEGVEYNVYSSSSLTDVATVLGTESDEKYYEISEMLTNETTDDLTILKKGFVLPGCSVSADRIKAACKEHSISLTNDYELADFIICEHSVEDSMNGTHANYPSRALLVHWSNGYMLDVDEDGNEDLPNSINVQHQLLYDKKLKDRHPMYNLTYNSAPYDNYLISGLAINLASLISSGDLKVVNIDTVLNASGNVQILTQELLEQLISMYNAGGEDREMLGTLLPTINYNKTPALLWLLSQELGNAQYTWSRNKDVKYWYDKSGLSDLANHSAEAAIEKFIEDGTMDSENFRMLEPVCRKEIYISNRALYSFRVEVKPEYRKYLKKQKI